MQFIFLVSLLASSINALPLNINLGAYSPALVVGDGEISFGGKQDVSNLMNALEGAAVSGAAANGQAGAAAPAVANPAPAQSAAPAAPAAAGANIVPDQDTQITSLQGMGKEIAPRIVKLERGQVISEKRDINGFNAALKFAADAIKTTPKIELGTENAGVGILQNAGISAGTAAAPAAGAAAPAQADEVLARSFPPKMKTTVTTMFVRGGPSPAQARSVDEPAFEKRAIDGVNLNMAEGQVAELTFVETREVGDDE